MRTRTTRTRQVSTVATALATGVLLAGCAGSGESEDESTGSASPTSTSQAPEQVSQTELGKAFDRLVHQRGGSSPDSGACLAKAARDSDLSEEALGHIVDSESDDIGDLAGQLKEDVDAKDAQTLLSVGLREQLDACVQRDAAPPTTTKDTAAEQAKKKKEEAKKKADAAKKKSASSSSTPTSKAEKKKAAQAKKKKQQEAKKRKARAAADKPDLKPRHTLRKNEKITSPSQLRKGLVTTFSSYAVDEQQKKDYQNASTCLSQAVYDAGFSQKTLRFLAGGPPIGTGSVVDHLPEEKDKEIWTSDEFTAALVDCTTGGGDGDEDFEDGVGD